MPKKAFFDRNTKNLHAHKLAHKPAFMPTSHLISNYHKLFQVISIYSSSFPVISSHLESSQVMSSPFIEVLDLGLSSCFFS